MDAAMAGGEALSMRWAFNANACSDGQRQGALTNGLQRRLMAATVAVEAFDGGGGWGPWIANLDGNAAFTCGGYGRQRGGSEAAGAWEWTTARRWQGKVRTAKTAARIPEADHGQQCQRWLR